MCVCVCALTRAFVRKPDLALELLIDLGCLGVGGSDVLQALQRETEWRGGEGRGGEGRGGEEG